MRSQVVLHGVWCNISDETGREILSRSLWVGMQTIALSYDFPLLFWNPMLRSRTLSSLEQETLDTEIINPAEAGIETEAAESRWQCRNSFFPIRPNCSLVFMRTFIVVYHRHSTRIDSRYIFSSPLRFQLISRQISCFYHTDIETNVSPKNLVTVRKTLEATSGTRVAYYAYPQPRIWITPFRAFIRGAATNAEADIREKLQGERANFWSSLKPRENCPSRGEQEGTRR